MSNGQLVQIPGYPVVTQTVAYTGTAAASSAFSTTTAMVRLRATTDCFIRFSTAGTAAAATDAFLPASETQDFAVRPSDRVSAIQSAANGTLYVSEFRLNAN
jgi:hypothetical protein